MIQLALPLLLTLSTGDNARFHPANADVYVEIADVKAAFAAYADAPLVKTLQDPAVARIAEAAKQMNPDIGAMLVGLMPTPDPSRPDDHWWPWSGLSSMSMSIAGLDTPAPTGTPWPERASGWIVLEFADAAAATQALTAIGASAGVTQVSVQSSTPAGKDGADEHPASKTEQGSRSPAASTSGSATNGAAATNKAETVKIEGADATVVRHEVDLFGNKVAFWLVQSGPRVVCGVGHAQPRDLVERLSKPESTFVAQHALLEKDSGLQSSCGVTIARAWSDLERVDVPGMIDERLGPEFVELGMAEFVPFVGQRGVHRLQLCKGQFVWESSTERIGPSRGLDDLYGTAPIAPSIARFVPKAAIGAWLLKVQPAKIEALVQRALARTKKPADGAPTDANAPHPFAAIGDSVAMFVMPLSMGNMGNGGISPNALMAIELKDATAFQTAFEAWIAHAQTNEPGLKVESKPYHKHAAYTFTYAKDATPSDDEDKAPTSAARPTLVILADRVVIASSRTYAQSEVRRIEAGGDDAHPLAVEGAIPKNAYEVSWFDWGAAIGKSYDMARGFLPLLLQSTGKSIDVSTLPTAAELFRYIAPSASYTARIDGKEYKHSVTSLGPETPLAGIALAIGITAYGERTAGQIASSAHVLPGVTAADGDVQVGHVVTVGSGASDWEKVRGDERSETSTALRDVKTGLAVYRSQFGRVPDTLDDLLKHTDAFPNGFLDGGAVPKDGWHHALVYATTDKGATYALRSCGANGVDDHGTGDDVLVP